MDYIGTQHLLCCIGKMLGLSVILCVHGILPIHQSNMEALTWDVLCCWWLYGLAKGDRKWNDFAKGVWMTHGPVKGNLLHYGPVKGKWLVLWMCFLCTCHNFLMVISSVSLHVVPHLPHWALEFRQCTEPWWIKLPLPQVSEWPSVVWITWADSIDGHGDRHMERHGVLPALIDCSMFFFLSNGQLCA